MEANELRLNNWVNHCNKEVQITIHDLFDIAVFEDDVFTPIPLTEEWLFKLGFEKIEEYQFEISVSINCRISLINVNLESGIDVDIYTCNVNKEYGCWLNTKNKYVHQLQNLYFALTGEELVLKN